MVIGVKEGQPFAQEVGGRDKEGGTRVRVLIGFVYELCAVY